MSDTQQAERTLVIRRAIATDAEALARLAERTFRATFAADNTPEDMALHCATEYGPGIQGAQIADSSIDTLVASDEGGTLIAYAQIRPGAPATATTPAPVELWRFYVDASQHGGGLAVRLMDAVVDAARARAARTLWLGVWERNPRAQKFYRKCGFVEIGTQTFVLGRDPQTDLLMARSLR